MSLPSIFIDDGGVMNDNSMRHEQWMDLVAEYLLPRYGGESHTWREANHQAIEILIKELDQRIKESQNLDFQKHQSLLDRIWINQMFDSVGVNRPPKHEYYRICREIENWVTPQVDSAIDGIIPVIRKLKSVGYPLYTASGETSWTLYGYLSGMGILDCFITLYGPDNPRMLELVDRLGAFTIQSCALEEAKPSWRHHYSRSEELPKLIELVVS
jgi:phosphoglycolate phosphatase-like HAD superfamily hydrolase